MTEDPGEYKYFSGKKPHRTYVTKRIEQKSFSSDNIVRKRGVSKVFEIPEFKEYIKEKKQIVLYTTPTERQQIKAWIEEDDRDRFTLFIQRFQTESGVPHMHESISFGKHSLETLFNFVQSLGFMDFSKPEGKKIEDSDLIRTKKILQEYLDDPEVLAQMANISKADIVAIGYRKAQLDIFMKMLGDETFFAEKKREWNKSRDEDAWQYFFQTNQWVFGYGLNYQFNSAVSTEQLKQTVKGHDVAGNGKEVDALLRTRGLISSLALVELKTHKTKLLKQLSSAYRVGAWQLSDELNGGIAQSHKNIEETLRNIHVSPALRLKTKGGDPTGEVVYSYQPKSYLIIGSLQEFLAKNGVNEEKFSSFELYRKNLFNPEIITFDELYERAKYIVHTSEDEVAKLTKDDSVRMGGDANIEISDPPF